MTTTETINNVCSELGITKAELAKRMGMLPSSLYRKLARESMTLEELQKTMDPSKYVGRAPRQVDVFLRDVVNPVLEANKEVLGMKAEINV